MQRNRKQLTMILVLTMVLTVSGVVPAKEGRAKLKEGMSSSVIVIAKGDTGTIATRTNQATDWVWSIANSRIAKITSSWKGGYDGSEGAGPIATIKGVKPGSTTVYGRSRGKTYKAKVLVVKKTAELNKSEVTLLPGKKAVIKVKFGSGTKKVKWKVIDGKKKIKLKIHGNKATVTAKKSGSVEMEVWVDGLELRCNIEINEKPKKKNTSSKQSKNTPTKKPSPTETPEETPTETPAATIEPTPVPTEVSA